MNSRAFLKAYGKALILAITIIAWFAVAEEIPNLSEMPVEENVPALPELSIVSPLSGETVNGSVIIIVAVSGTEECAEVNASNAEKTVFEGKACKENNFILDWNSEQAENGIFEISAKACNAEECSEVKIPVIVENKKEQEIIIPPTDQNIAVIIEQNISEQNQATVIEQNISEQNASPSPNPLIPEIPPEEEFFIKGSNEFSMLALKDLNGSLIDSSSLEVKAKKGKYNASIAFIDKAIKEIELENVQVDSNQELVEVDENINEREFESPEGFFQQIIAVNPKAKFSNGVMRLNAPSGSKALFKCRGWVFEEKKCQGSWEKIQEINGETILEIPISLTDPGFGFAKQNEVSFDRQLDCHKCGQHKVPPTSNVQMQISATTQEPLQNAVLADYFPTSWLLVDAQGGNVSDWNSEFRKIEWVVDLQDNVSKTYVVQSPERTLPPTKYYFFSQLNDFYSDYWRVIVADPATDVNLTVTGCSGGTAINSCSGLNILGTAQDVTNTKNAIFNAGMNNGAYTDSINSVKVYVNHSGATGITGAVAITLQNNAASTTYCSQNATIANTTSFKLDALTACTPTGGWTAAKLDDLNVSIKNTDGGGATLAYYDYITVAVNYNPNGEISFTINNPPSDNNTSVNNNTNFLVSGTTYCNTDNCGTVDTNLQYCAGAGCSSWIDMNTATDAPLYLISGSQPQSSALNAGQSYTVSWTVRSTIAQTYELRLRATGTTADTNNSVGTDRTITIQTPPADYSFTISLPLSGCSEGKGCLTSSCSACTRCFFDASTGTGSDANFADRNQVACQGQSGTQPFFKFTNTSTSSTAEDWDINLDVALGAPYKLKIGVLSTAYQANCDDTVPPTTGCVNVLGTTVRRIASALAVNNDQNAWVWADFARATPVGDYNRTLYHTSS